VAGSAERRLVAEASELSEEQAQEVIFWCMIRTQPRSTSTARRAAWLAPSDPTGTNLRFRTLPPSPGRLAQRRCRRTGIRPDPPQSVHSARSPPMCHLGADHPTPLPCSQPYLYAQAGFVRALEWLAGLVNLGGIDRSSRMVRHGECFQDKHDRQKSLAIRSGSRTHNVKEQPQGVSPRFAW